MSDHLHPSDRMTRREIEESSNDVDSDSRAVVDLTDEIFGSSVEPTGIVLLGRRVYHTCYPTELHRRQSKPIEPSGERDDYTVYVNELDLSARALRIQLVQDEIVRVESHPEIGRAYWYASFSPGLPPQFLPTDESRLHQGISRTHIAMLRRTLRVVKSALETY